MRWVIAIVLLCVILARSAEMRCSVYELQALSLSTHDPKLRYIAYVRWLQDNSKNCTINQLVYIQNRRSEWLGNADTLEVQAMINGLMEK